MTYLLIFW